jgi:hypothetical protein
MYISSTAEPDRGLSDLVTQAKGTRDADGGSTYQTPAEVAEAALAVLERRDPPPSAVSGWRNHLLTLPSRFFTRRAAVTLMGRSTLRTGGGSTRD